MPDEMPIQVENLGPNPSQKPSNVNPTADTASEPNVLKKGVTIGRHPIEKKVSLDSLESLRPA